MGSQNFAHSMTLCFYRLKYVVVQSSNVALAAAASLNANFPPVFSNAAVDMDGTNRFWVTDGGAVDNRGIDSLLFALRDAILRQKEITKGKSPVPTMHIIVADASASSIDYKQDRGMGSKFGAPEKFASQLMDELVAQINDLCRDLSGGEDKVHLHYLAMPNTLRMRGGLGTHWMLPHTVRLSDTSERDPNKAYDESVRVDSEVVQKLISELHQTNQLFTAEESTELTQVRTWIVKDTHRKSWLRIQGELKK